MAIPIIAAVVLSFAAGVLLVYYLIKVTTALRSISAKLANARLLLLVVTSQTEPAGELIGGVGTNITALHELVTGVARSLAIPVPGAR